MYILNEHKPLKLYTKEELQEPLWADLSIYLSEIGSFHKETELHTY